MQRNTIRHTVRDLQLHRPALEDAAAVLRGGGLVVFPTETVYGIGANARNPRAVADIFRAKGRPQDNPLIVHITGMEELEPLVRQVPPSALRLAERFWPGPLTLILPRSEAVPDVVSAGLDTVAVRMPSHPVARALISMAGVPVAAPSANRSGRPSPTEADHCAADLHGRVDRILDGGSCAYGLESTVLSLTGDTPRLLRPGFITPEELREELGEIEIDEAVCAALKPGAAAASPGMKYKHYAPKASMILVHGSFAAFRRLVAERAETEPGVWALVFDGEAEHLPVPGVAYGEESDPAGQAERLFSSLHRLDETDARTVYVRAPSPAGVGLAVYNRLVRACAFTELYLEA